MNLRVIDNDTAVFHQGIARAVSSAAAGLHSRRRSSAVNGMFLTVLCKLGWNTGEVLASVDELAQLVECSTAEAEFALAFLVSCEVLDVGPGGVGYFANPHAMWHGTPAAHAAACAGATPPGST